MSELSSRDSAVLLPDSNNIAGFDIHDVVMCGQRTVFLRVTDDSGQSFCMKVPNLDSVRDQTLRGRFEREVQILQLLRGRSFPHLQACGTYATANAAGIPYIVTDLPRGETLDQILANRRAARTPPDVPGGIALLGALTRALAGVHQAGVVHRYLKPQKIAVEANGEVQILDFVLGLGAASRSLTPANSFVGAASYVAPEQARNASKADGRADLYSLGLIIYEVVTHEHPFQSDPNAGMSEVVKHFTQQIQPPSNINRDVPPALDQIIVKLGQRQPADRYQTTEELLADLTFHFPGI